ncbi:MAG: hypothetical protein M1835_002766 [Candelina submexicana]|nr:MAG: hypothetical protein M1835_002766 [Candelina submexicana]
MDPSSTKIPTSAPAKVEKDVFLGVIWTGVGISFLCLLIRLYARWRSFKRFWFDDALVAFAWLLALLTAIDWQMIAGYMYQTISITSGQLWPPPATFVNDIERYFKGSLVIWVFFLTSLWAVKFAFLLFFRRLGKNVTGQKVLWWLVFAFTLATYLVSVGTLPYSCLTGRISEAAQNCTSNAKIRLQRAILKLACAVDILTDYMIMAIPISMLWRSQMSLRKKLVLAGIVSLTVITTVFAIVRVTSVSALSRQPDAPWANMWSFIELCIAIIVACLASFRSLFTSSKTRLPKPKQGSSDNSHNLFRQGIKRTLPSQTALELASIFKKSGESEIRSTDNEQVQDWKGDIESARGHSTDHIVSSTNVWFGGGRVRHGENTLYSPS